MKKELTLLVFAGMVCVFLLAGVIAANDNAAEMKDGKAVVKADDNSTMTGAKNGTYGQCVVAGVQIKNACYDAVKQARADCISATNDSAATKQCKADYKKDTKQCKTDFKAAKKECIRTTKPGMWARLRYSMS